MAPLARVKGEVIIICLDSPVLGELPVVCFEADQELSRVCLVALKPDLVREQRHHWHRLWAALEWGVGTRNAGDARGEGM